jgi:hypothetical protein
LELTLEAAKRHIDDTPPVELSNVLRAVNQLTRRDR